MEDIKWLGHASFKITGEKIIYIDPYLSPDERRQMPPLVEPRQVTNADLPSPVDTYIAELEQNGENPYTGASEDFDLVNKYLAKKEDEKNGVYHLDMPAWESGPKEIDYEEEDSERYAG